MRFAASGWRVILRPSGALDMLCLFHVERTPSLRVWPSGKWLCHGCRRSGDMDELLGTDSVLTYQLAQIAERERVEGLERAGQLRLDFYPPFILDL